MFVSLSLTESQPLNKNTINIPYRPRTNNVKIWPELVILYWVGICKWEYKHLVLSQFPDHVTAIQDNLTTCEPIDKSHTSDQSIVDTHINSIHRPKSRVMGLWHGCCTKDVGALWTQLFFFFYVTGVFGNIGTMHKVGAPSWTLSMDGSRIYCKISAKPSHPHPPWRGVGGALTL